MKKVDGQLAFSSRDLTGHLSCAHLTTLELRVTDGTLKRPKPWDPSLEALWERGFRHERGYLDHLASSGLDAVVVPGVDVDDAAVAATLNAMADGVPIIVQAALRSGRWIGRADVLHRVEVPSALGPWSYEVHDTKLSRTTKADTILQLCLYSDLLADMQGRGPELVHVVPPWTDYTPEVYRVSDYSAYYRRVRDSMIESVARTQADATYPEPNAHCDICAWRIGCAERRRADDHLSLVAGMTSLQAAELRANGIDRLSDLAAMPLPMSWRPARGAVRGLERLREQARLQVAARIEGLSVFETQALETGFGLAALPEPSAGDIYLDFEGDAFVGENGQEYLLGYSCVEEDGALRYVALWGLTRADERRAFETFMDFVLQRLDVHPDLHVYHYGGYETGALKRLMGRYATREDDLDRLLRGRVFVDLLGVVRHAIVAGVENYSIKRLEPLYGFVRDTALPDANIALNRFQNALELGDVDDITEADRIVVQSYNEDDCASTRALHLWLEFLRGQLIAEGAVIERPELPDGAAPETVSAWRERILPLMASLTGGVPDDESDRTPEQHGRWLLANLLDFHRREEKAGWWEFFRLADLDADELVEERAAIGGGLELRGTVGGTAKCPVHRYAFGPQETDVRPGKKLRAVGGDPLGAVESFDPEACTIDIRKSGKSADLHPTGVFVHEHVGSEPMMESLVRLAEYVVERGLVGVGAHQAARDLLLRLKPSSGEGGALVREGETTLDAALRIAGGFVSGVLPVQGPPGAGKTYTGSRMILEMVAQGRRVGIVANSHAVVRNLIDAVIQRADEQQVELTCVQKPGEREPDGHRLRMVTKNGDLAAALRNDCAVGGGTAWFWSSPDAFELVDVLFVDEAAQMSLANVLAISQAAPAVVMLGDPMQLDQPMQGSHPEGTDTSALDHILGDAQTIGEDAGLFLGETWRLHPAICTFTSDMFYEGKLRSRAGLERQCVSTRGDRMSGLRYVAVEHAGNSNCSPEEADVVVELVRGLIESDATWTDAVGLEKPLGIDDVVVITPYNAQVFEIRQRLPGARVGTVDKFQGQEAAVAIYSLATSSPADAPRGMDFLYSLNRLNVATSRARCLSYLICNPAIFGAECRGPKQIRLANSFCRFLELSE
ncbi:uncharacterized protein C8J46_10963 [Sphingomonas sp. PP-F2F-A104-K0414]|uniref:TM0106 family RecB-like putative nuclease n=1 Tax=Sphingomonas sp. PP-F2F-A104-K0414 TaxID=2135661 RepID=UPI00104B4FF9|nr:TM0106 family RecB-like putative nuclease [Sphingomonas sp. PP-F2F-A104-K0414]TCP96368.1 uncharacterized protein C8J46_10963 [Sphingomonas sp. PP-F2F-A104-K0414]